jgi:hypothetical protein
VNDLDEFLGEYRPIRLRPGERADICRGLVARQNSRNPFLVLTLRYEADPAKDPLTEEGRAWLLARQRDMGCYRVCRGCERIWSVYEAECPDCGSVTELVLSNRWRREYEIDYEAQSGSYVFDSFSRGRNTCKPFRVPPSWHRWRTIDHGVRNPTCCLWIAVDPDGFAWVYGEHYEAERTIDYHARKIHEISARLDAHALDVTATELLEMEQLAWEPPDRLVKAEARLYRTIGDPSMANRTQKEAKTVIHRYADHGIYIVRANNTMAGLETLNSMFNQGTLTIFETCEHLIHEVEHLVWDENVDPSRNKKERPVARNDHAVDALRYWANAFAPPADEKEAFAMPALTGNDRARLDQQRFQQRYQQGRATDPILDL